MTLEEELFLKQYDQAWQQKRHHDNHIWTIPTIFLSIVTFGIFNINFSYLTDFTKSFILPGGFFFSCFGIGGLMLRHTFFESSYRLLIRQMDQQTGKPYQPVPQTAKELGLMFRDELHRPARWGAHFLFSWPVTGVSLILSTILFLIVVMDQKIF